MFGLTLPPWEIFIRGTAMYWALLLLFRFIVRRRIGAVGMSDVLLLVIVADAAQNGMAGDYKSVTDGVLLVATLIGWNLFADWLTYRFDIARKLLEPKPLLLVYRGRLQQRNLRTELISHTELWSKLREHGVTDLAQVEKAYMESDGAVSVIKRG